MCSGNQKNTTKFRKVFGRQDKSYKFLKEFWETRMKKMNKSVRERRQMLKNLKKREMRRILKIEKGVRDMRL